MGVLTNTDSKHPSEEAAPGNAKKIFIAVLIIFIIIFLLYRFVG